MSYQDLNTSRKIQETVAHWTNTLKPPPKLTVSEWADRYRYLSPEASAEPGKWNTDRAPYQRGIMDAASDDSVTRVVFMSSAQVGKTEILNNIIGYYIDQDPAPMLFLQPTLEMGEAWSKDRLAPMLRDTPRLTGKVGDAKSKDGQNTLRHKKFPGGHITIAGANSPASLASRPVRIVACDEVDRYPESAGTEGDPVKLAEKRTTTFWNKKQFQVSTPTIKGSSRIEASYESSDQRRYFVPCPHCDEYQHLKWSQIKFDKEDPENSTHYICEHCGTALNESDKYTMLTKGEWRATAPFKGTAGFHLNELYSPWKKWVEVVTDFLEAKKLTETLKVWVNTSLGETWEEDAEKVDPDDLLSRREDYPAQLPRGVLVLTAGVDVQHDRLEVEIKGWGVNEESWSIDYRMIHGSPFEAYVWETLDLLWRETFTHETGDQLLIDAACVDSGYATSMVYDYCRDKKIRRIFCIKGQDGQGRPATSAPSLKRSGRNRRPVDLYNLGVDSIKAVIYQRLKNTHPGPGYMHFPMKYQEDYFKQLTSEKMVVEKVRGYTKRVWKKMGIRNEVLDCNVYSYAALKILNPPLKQLEERFNESGKVRLPANVKKRGYRSKGIS